MSIWAQIKSKTLGRLRASTVAPVPNAVKGAISTQTQTMLRGRIQLAIIVYSLIICAIFGRLVQFSTMPRAADDGVPSSIAETTVMVRPEIVDRNGEILATDVKVASVYAEPKKIIDPDDAAEQIANILPNINVRELRDKLAAKRGFVWIKRKLTPAQQQSVHSLGLPGIGFTYENHRIYPAGNVGAHILGAVNVDNQGIAGLEKYIDNNDLSESVKLSELPFKKLKPLRLSVDLKVQHALRDEMVHATERYKTVASAGMLLNVHTGEIVAMVSLPDFDSNSPKDALQPDRLNRVLAGTFEMGSTFKAFTLAMGLDSGKYTLSDKVDASSDLYIGKHSIGDFHGQYRALTIPEVFTYSSNIATAKVALAHGIDGHKSFLKKLGMFDRIRTELPESADPIVPKHWGQINSATIAFGHGITVTPIQATVGAAALVNGGYLLVPTVLPRTPELAHSIATRVIREETSDAMRYLFRLNVEKGTAKKAEVEGYNVGGKTGTAEKVVNGRYSKDKRFTTFMATFPSDKPDYLLLVILDEPHSTPDSGGYATAGWNAAPTAGKIIARAAPLLGMQPRLTQLATLPVATTGAVNTVTKPAQNAAKNKKKTAIKPKDSLAKSASKATPKLAQSNTGPVSLDDLIQSVHRR